MAVRLGGILMPILAPTCRERIVHMEPLTVSVADAGRIVGLGKTKLYELIGQGELDAVRIGKRTLIKTASLKRLVGEAV